MWSEEELEDLVRDIMCAVVHRYLECVISETFIVRML
jgi:hypothetical protein